MPYRMTLVRSLRVGRREHGGQPGALRYPEDRGPLGAHGVEHGEDVVRPLLECRGGQHAASVREPAAPAVEDDKPTELGQPPEERGKRRLFPEHLDVGRQPVGPHEIHRALTDDLVGDAHIARPGVPRDRLAHRCLSQSWLRSTILLLHPRPMARATHQALHGASRRDGACGALPPERVHSSTEDKPMQHVKVNGVELAYEVVGRGEPILFIHGAHIADAMRPLVEDPALDRFQRIRYHRRGVGGSMPAGGAGNGGAVHADDAVGLLEHLGVDRAHLVGHSIGGSIALEIASRHPTRVSSLVLLEPGLLMAPSGAAFIDLVTPLVGRYEGGDAESAVHGFLALVGDRDWRTAIERTVPGGIAQAVKDAATFFGSELPAVSDWTFGPEQAAAITCPVLSVLGARRAPCSSKVCSCSTRGSRSATTRTSPARATCSRWKPPDPSRQRSPPLVPTLSKRHRCG